MRDARQTPRSQADDPVATPDDTAMLTALLGRRPQGAFEVVVRDRDGWPVVVRNAPLLFDGRPMPTRYYLVGRREVVAVSRLEAAGGVRAAERELDPQAVAEVHRRAAAERDAAMPPGHRGPRPAGGVGGTRLGVKCLHAHYGWHLAGGDDLVGRWVAERLAAAGRDSSHLETAHAATSAPIDDLRAAR